MKFFKVLISLSTVAFLSWNAMAQDSQTVKSEESNARWYVSATLGANNYAGVSAMSGTQAVYETQATSTLWTSKGVAFGFEGGVQIGPSWRILLGGNFNYSYNPGYSEKTGTAVPGATVEENWGEVPTYKSVSAQASYSYQVYTGADYMFLKDRKLRPYLGLRFGGAYASNQQQNQDDAFAMGKSLAEQFFLKTAIVGGADYFFDDEFYVGVALNIVDYTYGVTRYKPQEGLSALGADSHGIGAFANPTLKLGFRFGGKHCESECIENAKKAGYLSPSEAALAIAKAIEENPRIVEKVVTKEVIKEVPVEVESASAPTAAFFQLNSSSLTNADKARVKLYADAIKEGPKDQVYVVTGYADKATGSVEGNKKVSEKRARVLYDALIAEGVAPSQLEVVAGGGVDPMFFDDSTLSRAAIVAPKN